MKNVALIPAYNEEKNILITIKKIKNIRVFNKIIVIDDGSKDKTAEIARKAGAIVIQHKINKGKGGAVKSGVDYVLKHFPKTEKIVLIDADLQFDPTESVKFLKALDDAEFVMGYRNWDKVPFRHRLGNLAWRTFFNFFFGTKLKDSNCGFMAMSRKAFEKLDFSAGYTIDNYIVIQIVKNNLRIKQVPVKVFYKKNCNVKNGVRIVSKILLFIVIEGIKYRLRIGEHS